MTEAEFADLRPGDVIVLRGNPERPLTVRGPDEDAPGVECLYFDAPGLLQEVAVRATEHAMFAMWEES